MSKPMIISSTKEGFMTYNPNPSNITFTEAEMSEAVNLYWKSLDERMFVAPFWQIEQLLTQSASKQVAIKFHHLDNPARVTGEWVAFDEEMTTPDGLAAGAHTIQDASERITMIIANLVNNAGEAYYVIDRNIVEAFASGVRAVADGNFPYQTVSVRLGEQENGQKTAYFILGELKLHLGVASRSMGAACGVKIPPK